MHTIIFSCIILLGYQFVIAQCFDLKVMGPIDNMTFVGTRYSINNFMPVVKFDSDNLDEQTLRELCYN